MSTAKQPVRSLCIPLQGQRSLLLPNVAVAEIVDYQEPVPVEGAPQWLLGEISWRGQQLPLVHYEALCGDGLTERQRDARLAIINTVKDHGGVAFYALLTAGIPRLLRVGADLSAQADGQFLDAQTLAQVELNGQAATIPDLDSVEETVASHWHKAA